MTHTVYPQILSLAVNSVCNNSTVKFVNFSTIYLLNICLQNTYNCKISKQNCTIHTETKNQMTKKTTAYRTLFGPVARFMMREGLA